jgi:Tol biopolymer transport system component
VQTSRTAWGLATAVAGMLVLSIPAKGQGTTRISVTSAGAEAISYSELPVCDDDGNVVAFESVAWNLVPKDLNHASDIFVHDLATGVTERVSVSSSGVEGNYESYRAAISSDGQIVAFESFASNLVSGDTNFDFDVFIRDRSTGTTERVSVDSSGGEADGGSFDPSLTPDAGFVAFVSYATNLVAGDTNDRDDVFVKDRSTGAVERVSVNSLGGQVHRDSYDPSISSDGRFVAFTSDASTLVSGDNNGSSDVFVHDRVTGITERVSIDSSGAEGNGASDAPAISADGSLIAFESYASNLTAGDSNGAIDVFVHDRTTGTTERVSVDSSGAEGTFGGERPSISSDGLLVAFESYSPNLVHGDTDGTWDVFVRDRSASLTRRVSLSTDGQQPDFVCGGPSISGDGRVVSYWSGASNLVDGDTNASDDIFLHEPCEVDATWSNYGTGFPGTNGVPAFTSQSNPVLGMPLTLDLACSSGGYTVGIVLIGTQQANIPTRRGGNLLVVPLFTMLVALAPTGTVLRGDLPPADSLCGAVVDLQALEIDPGAALGYSFSPGLELVFGR